MSKWLIQEKSPSHTATCARLFWYALGDFNTKRMCIFFMATDIWIAACSHAEHETLQTA